MKSFDCVRQSNTELFVSSILFRNQTKTSTDCKTSDTNDNCNFFLIFSLHNLVHHLSSLRQSGIYRYPDWTQETWWKVTGGLARRSFLAKPVNTVYFNCQIRNRTFDCVVLCSAIELDHSIKLKGATSRVANLIYSKG